MIKYLRTADGKCVGCMSCTSACSRLYFREDNPAKACIQVNDLSSGAFHLVACDQECMACVRECPTQALRRGASGAIVLDRKKCVGCLACVSVCPIGAMRWFPGAPVVFKCIACGACARACPKQALEVVTKEEPPASAGTGAQPAGAATGAPASSAGAAIPASGKGMDR